MKPIRLILASALALGVTAPGLAAQTAPAAPQPMQVDAAGLPPANWWQLDPQKDHVRGIGLERAYGELLRGRQPRRPVVVAIIDSGVEIDHPDLAANLWTNPREVAGNGRDDDGNGYVDDVHGWDFIGGRDGRDVSQDTYESVRIYAALRSKCEPPASAPAADCALYGEVKAKLAKDRSDDAETLGRVKEIGQALDAALPILRQALGGDSVTVERVQELTSVNQSVQQARGIFLELAANGITPKVVAETRDELQKRLQYGLNPDFNPRTIVGDNYADVNERGYGNAEVEGPDASHGTHVAGIIAGIRGNGLGADGVDGVPGAVQFMVLRAVPDGDERDKDIANAIRYAADNGARVINMSFGKAYSPQKAAVDAAVKYAESKGVLFVHAAGNEAADLATSPSYPTRTYLSGGAAANWIEVGASSWQGADSLAASFSNYSRTAVDVFAPGVSIYSSIPNGGYDRFDGTSMAAPVVTGLAALILSYYPDFTAAQVKQIILDSATRYADTQVIVPGKDQRLPFSQLSATGGVVNAYNALRLAAQRAGAH